MQSDDTAVCFLLADLGERTVCLCSGLDTDLEGELEDNGQSPPTKRAKETPGQSKLARQDHSESRMLHYFEESDKLHRLDAEAERAHQCEMVRLSLMKHVHHHLQCGTAYVCNSVHCACNMCLYICHLGDGFDFCHASLCRQLLHLVAHQLCDAAAIWPVSVYSRP